MTQSPQAGAPAANQFGVFKVHYPSEKQVRFIKNLVSQRVNPAGDEFATMVVALNDGTLNQKAASRMIDMLMEMPEKPKAASQAGFRAASQKQFDFIKSLIASKELNPAAESAVQMGREAAMAGTLSATQASALIDVLKALPRKQVVEVELESGMYRTGAGTVYKVYKTVHGSGKMCAKELIVEQTEDGPTGYFDYRGLAQRFVKPEQRMTLEEAKAFGVIYGVCCKCGATLTDETSIANGIGPVCGAKGW